MSTTTQRQWEPTSRTDGRAGGPETGIKLLLTVGEAAHRLSIGRTLMYELLCSGQIDSIHVGRLHRVPAEALADYVTRQRVPRDKP
jgi:excisionase family DNA binding protein